MRWTFRLGLPFLLVFAAFAAWPFVDLYRLVHAIERQDLAELRQRTEWRALAASLNRQVLQTYLRLTGKEAHLGPFGQMLIGTTSIIVDRAFDDLATPERVAAIMTAGGGDGEGQQTPQALLPSGLRSFWELYAGSEYSFDEFYVTLPPAAEPAKAFRVRLRLIRWTWKLHDIQLPAEARTRLAYQILSVTGGR